MANLAKLCLCAVSALALLLTTACRAHRSTPGPTRVVLQADWYPQPEHGGYYTALLKGYYKAEGLDVSIAPGGPYLSAEQQVAVNAAQFAMGSSDRVLEAVANGQPLVAVMATMQHDPQGVIVHQQSNIHTFADLEGHAVAVKPGSTWFTYLVHRYRLANVSEIPDNYGVANFVHDPDYVQQAFATSEPYFTQKAGAATRFLLVSDTGYNPYRVIFTSQGYLRDHPDAMAKFVRASIRGWRDYLADPAMANAEIARLNPAMSQDWMRFSWRALKQGQFVTGPDLTGADIGQMTAPRWTTMYQQLVELKMITRPFDPSVAYTLRFLPPQ